MSYLPNEKGIIIIEDLGKKGEIVIEDPRFRVCWSLYTMGVLLDPSSSS